MHGRQSTVHFFVGQSAIARPHSIKVGYVGINGDGHLGRLNLTNSYYYAFGRDNRNPIAGRGVHVSSQMAAVEAFETALATGQTSSRPAIQ